MGDQTQAYDIFQTPLSSGYPLPLTAGYFRAVNDGPFIFNILFCFCIVFSIASKYNVI
jgi:hypothetical protein